MIVYLVDRSKAYAEGTVATPYAAAAKKDAALTLAKEARPRARVQKADLKDRVDVCRFINTVMKYFEKD